MKTGLQIISYQNGKFGAKRRGLFGWKHLVEIYDGNWSWHYSWSYFLKPDGYGYNDMMDTEKEMITALKGYYHGSRKLREVL